MSAAEGNIYLDDDGVRLAYDDGAVEPWDLVEWEDKLKDREMLHAGGLPGRGVGGNFGTRKSDAASLRRFCVELRPPQVLLRRELP